MELDALLLPICLFLLFILNQQPWEPLLLTLSLRPVPVPPPLFVICFTLIPPAATPPVIHYFLNAMDWPSEAHHRSTLEARASRLAGEVTAVLLAGFVQVAFQIMNEQPLAPPREILTAMLLATAMAALWDRLWERARDDGLWDETRDDFFLYMLQQKRRSCSSLSPALSLLPPAKLLDWSLWKRILRLLLLTFLSGAWIWPAVFALVAPTTRPAFQWRVLLATVAQVGLFAGHMLYHSSTSLVHKLRRRPPAC